MSKFAKVIQTAKGEEKPERVRGKSRREDYVGREGVHSPGAIPPAEAEGGGGGAGDIGVGGRGAYGLAEGGTVKKKRGRDRAGFGREGHPSAPLKWAGGKRWLADTIAELYAPHRHRRLVEPFVGGLAIALTLKPERALLNDINPHLINFYRWLQRGLRIDIVLENDPEVTIGIGSASTP